MYYRAQNFHDIFYNNYLIIEIKFHFEKKKLFNHAQFYLNKKKIQLKLNSINLVKYLKNSVKYSKKKFLPKRKELFFI